MGTSNGELDLEYFRKIGFDKRVCNICGKYYWTSDPERKTCGDPPCDSYSFIGRSPVAHPYTLNEVRSLFLDFFKDTHKILSPYPVVPRWRDDVLLVNASIYDFQPHVTSGRVRPPGNPIAMSQPSIRTVDIDVVGETGRHLTNFEMLCHDSFNYQDAEVYWKEETVEYCYRFFTESLKVDGKLISFKEKPWSGGGNGGNAFEVFILGLEVATLVFMDMKEDPDGVHVIDGKKYSKMDMKIVDTGYGLERMVWLSQATPTIYEAVMPYAVSHILENATISHWDPEIQAVLSAVAARIEPFDRYKMLEILGNRLSSMGRSIGKEDLEKFFEQARSVYVLADHTKTLLTMFTDYVIPSNVKVGYVARLLIRRALRAKSECQYKGSLFDLIQLHHEEMKSILPDYPVDFIKEALAGEEARFEELFQKSEGIVLRLFDKKGNLSEDDMVVLYDSSGITPETADRIIQEKRGKKMKIPEDFNNLVISRHDQQVKSKKDKETYPEIFTRPLYYDDTSLDQFNALVLYSSGKKIIPNQTAFYPEGGGQPSDLGHFIYKGKKVEMLKAEKHGDAIVHHLEGEIPEHSRIIGHIDYTRRRRLMVHHTATHLLLGVLREVLGEHVWQSGAQKGTDRSRIDVTHFRKPTSEQIATIERKCLEYITDNREVSVKNLEWNKAISKYGFRLFEGGIPEGKTIRVVEISGVDAEGCGGTHVKSTGELGFLKIIRVDTIQEGIQRFTFVAGEAALDYVQEIYSTSQVLESELSVGSDKAREGFMRLLNENITLKKDREKRIKASVNSAVSLARHIMSKGTGIDFISGSFDEDEMKLIISTLFSQKREIVIIVNNPDSEPELRVITSGRNAKEICACFEKETGSSVNGSERHAWIRSKVALDETLIKKILDNCGLWSN